ncbi:hypothetical protein Hypma_002010 [Hypsizygus marmoreus]|uniref:Uncharacterized protein n=1 Tax=Hypsizygus marmoreus TaxID=39966 RepID=A0A369J8A3_HYPMA|nr:hypothetical protein Hypma_002010 [Hypsizygus marmoreus]
MSLVTECHRCHIAYEVDAPPFFAKNNSSAALTGGHACTLSTLEIRSNSSTWGIPGIGFLSRAATLPSGTYLAVVSKPGPRTPSSPTTNAIILNPICPHPPSVSPFPGRPCVHRRSAAYFMTEHRHPTSTSSTALHPFLPQLLLVGTQACEIAILGDAF